MAASPKYLTGDGAGIKEFIDKFDVSYLRYAMTVDASYAN